MSAPQGATAPDLQPGAAIRSPLSSHSALAPFGKACAITRIVHEIAMRHVGVAAAHRIAADVFESIDPSEREASGA